jgi:hypothetical protein
MTEFHLIIESLKYIIRIIYSKIIRKIKLKGQMIKIIIKILENIYKLLQTFRTNF